MNLLSVVYKVISFDDSDGSACGAIRQKQWQHMEKLKLFLQMVEIEQTQLHLPEYKTYGGMNNVEFAFGIGGTDKLNSSSWLLDEWKAPNRKVYGGIIE